MSGDPYHEMYKNSYQEHAKKEGFKVKSDEIEVKLADVSDNLLSHVDSEGKASMVDVSDKKLTQRSAVAKAKVILGREAFQQVQNHELKKGDVLTVAQLAGIMGAKMTSNLIPLCHPLSLTSVKVNLALVEEDCSVEVTCEAKVKGQTGVEMEALTGASVAALTVYDMCKAVTKDMVIADLRLIEKRGGKSDFKK